MSQQAGKKRFLISGLIYLPFLLLFIALFNEAIFHARLFSFRDAVHFYYPLYERIQESLLAGKLPFWDPLENLGQPLLANPAAAVFYPGKLIFFLQLIPGISYGFCFKWYTMLHLAGAFGAFYLMARRIGSRPASIFGGLAYTFGGPVLFQYTNVIFLVAAAWFPLVILALMGWQESGRVRYLILGALALAMTILGGEPESVYFSAIAVLIYLPIAAWGRRRRIGQDDEGTFRSRRLRIWGLAAMFAGAAVLAAVQILPGLELARYSNRNSGAVSVWELPMSEIERQTEENISNDSRWSGILCRGMAHPESREREIYRFSLQPRRFPEMIWGNLGGEIFPQNSRWIASLPNGANEWNGSLYLGLFPLFTALIAVRFCFRAGEKSGMDTAAANRKILFELRRIFFTFLAVIFLLGALGGFGPAWLVRGTVRIFGGDGSLDFQAGDPVGGIYWWLTQLLPGFASFRYPAKLMTAAVLPISALAVCGFDLVFRGIWHDSRFFRLFRIGCFILSAGLIAAAVGGWGIRWVEVLISGRSTTGFYGPIQYDLLRRIWLISGIRAAVLLAVLEFLLWYCRRNPFSYRLAAGVILILCIDLYSAQRWQISTVPEQVMNRPTPMARYFEPDKLDIEQDQADLGETVKLPVRFYRSWRLIPQRFLSETSKNRPAELALWQRATGMVHLSDEWNGANLSASGTFCPADYAQIKQTFREKANDGNLEQTLAFFGCQYLLWPAGGDGPDASRCYCCAASGQGDRFPAGTALWRMASPCERVRIFHSDFDEEFRTAIASRQKTSPIDGEEVRWQAYEPEYLAADVNLLSPGYLLFAEQYWPGWQAEAVPLTEGRGKTGDNPNRIKIDVLRDAQCLRRIDLPAGRWRVEMRYHPKSFIFGALLSLTGWLVLVCWLVKRYKQNRLNTILKTKP